MSDLREERVTVSLSPEQVEAIEFAEAAARYERRTSWWNDRSNALRVGKRARALRGVLIAAQKIHHKEETPDG